MQHLDEVFSALADGTRRSILARLSQGETALSEIAEPFAMSQTAVTKHVRVLSRAGLVAVTKRGRTRYCRLDATPMKGAVAWLETYEKFWQDNFQALARHLEGDS